MRTGAFRFRRSGFLGRQLLELEHRHRYPDSPYGCGRVVHEWELGDRSDADRVFLALHERFGATYCFKQDWRGRYYLLKTRKSPAELPGDFHHYYSKASFTEALTVFAMMKGMFT